MLFGLALFGQVGGCNSVRLYKLLTGHPDSLSAATGARRGRRFYELPNARGAYGLCTTMSNGYARRAYISWVIRGAPHRAKQYNPCHGLYRFSSMREDWQITVLNIRTTHRARNVLLVACAAVALGATAGHADVQAIGSWGSWTVSQGTFFNNGRQTCQLWTTNGEWVASIGVGAGDQMLGFIISGKVGNPVTNLGIAFDGNSDFGKPNNVMAIPSSPPGAYSLWLTIDPPYVRDFVHQFTAGTTMRYSFNGAQQPWTISLSGTMAAWGPFMECAKAVAPAVVASLTPGQTATPAPAPQQAPTPAPAPSQQLPAVDIFGDNVVGEAALISEGGGLYKIDAALNGRQIAFELDSGASDVVIPKSTAKMLVADGTLTPADFLGNVTSVLADGSKVSNPAYLLHTVAVAGRTVHDVRCLVGEDNTSLLLGQAFLRRFKSWTVDNARHVLVLGEPAV